MATTSRKHAIFESLKKKLLPSCPCPFANDAPSVCSPFPFLPSLKRPVTVTSQDIPPKSLSLVTSGPQNPMASSQASHSAVACKQYRHTQFQSVMYPLHLAFRSSVSLVLHLTAKSFIVFLGHCKWLWALVIFSPSFCCRSIPSNLSFLIILN